jgi:outer membrane usher protein
VLAHARTCGAKVDAVLIDRGLPVEIGLLHATFASRRQTKFKAWRATVVLLFGLPAAGAAHGAERIPQGNLARYSIGQPAQVYRSTSSAQLLSHNTPALIEATLLESDVNPVATGRSSDLNADVDLVSTIGDIPPVALSETTAPDDSGQLVEPKASATNEGLFASAADRAILSLELNGLEFGDTVIYLRSEDALVALQDLEKAGLSGFAGLREDIDGAPFVSLRSLAPSITFQLDVQHASLRVTADPKYFRTRVLDFSGVKAPSSIHYSNDTSLFVNYSLGLSDFDRFRAFAETGLSLAGKYLIYTSAFRNPNGTFGRGLTNVTIDDRSHLRRWVLGDAMTATSDPLGGAALIGGVSVSKNFALDPYFIKFPQQSLSGSLMSPSTVEVYRNGTLIRREELPPGTFNLRDIPFSAGDGVTRVVVHDAFGQVQELRNFYYLNTEVLKPGLSQFAYALGFARPSFGTTSFKYGDLAYQGYHLFGLTDWFTGGFRFEGRGFGDLVNGGVVFAATTGIGAIRGSAAASRDGSASGFAANLAYSYVRRDLSFGFQASMMSPDYTNLSLSPETDRPLYDFGFFGGLALGPWISVIPDLSWAKFRDAGSRKSAGLALDFQLPFNATMLVAARYSRQRSAGSSLSVSANLVFSFGGGTTFSASHDRDFSSKRRDGTSVQFSKSLPLGPGYGYLLKAEQNDENFGGVADLRYRSGFGSYEAAFQKSNGRTTSDLTMAGGVVVLGGRVFATRPVGNAFALLRTPGLSGIEGTLYNQSMGVTDKRGGLLIPDLMPYFGNEIGIKTEGIPIEYQIDATKDFVAPPNRGGAVVDFPIRRIQAILGKVEVVTAGKTVIPKFGELTINGTAQTFTSPIGRNGEFYLDSPPPGRYHATIDFEDGECRFDIEIPKASSSIVKLAMLSCIMRSPQ